MLPLDEGSLRAVGALRLGKAGDVRVGQELVTEPFFRPLRQYPGALVCDVWGPKALHRNILTEQLKVRLFFFLI